MGIMTMRSALFSRPAPLLSVAALCLAAFPAWAREPVSVRVVQTENKKNGRVKVEVEVTDAKPIIFGALVFDAGTTPLDSVSAITLNSKAGDAVGVATALHGKLQVNFGSPSGSVGVSPNIPIMAFSLDPQQQRVELRLDPDASRFLDPTGQPYAHELGPSAFSFSDISVTELIPASGVVAAGSEIIFNGSGFQTGTDVQIDGVDGLSVRFVSASQILVSTQQTFRIDGRRIRVSNPNGSVEAFHSEPVISTLGQSSRKLLAGAIPIFPRQSRTTGLFAPVAAGPNAGANFITGLALQNMSAIPASVSVEVFSAGGDSVGQVVLILPPASRVWREISELMPGIGALTDGSMVVRASQPIQMLQLLGDEGLEILAPIAARAIRTETAAGNDNEPTLQPQLNQPSNPALAGAVLSNPAVQPPAASPSTVSAPPTTPTKPSDDGGGGDDHKGH